MRYDWGPYRTGGFAHGDRHAHRQEPHEHKGRDEGTPLAAEGPDCQGPPGTGGGVGSGGPSQLQKGPALHCLDPDSRLQNHETRFPRGKLSAVCCFVPTVPGHSPAK